MLSSNIKNIIAKLSRDSLANLAIINRTNYNTNDDIIDCIVADSKKLHEFNKHDLTYLTNNNVFIFDKKYIKNTSTLITELGDIVVSRNIFNEKKIIFILNFDMIKYEDQVKLRYTFENSHTTSKFIITCTNIDIIDPAINSRCNSINIKTNDVIEKVTKNFTENSEEILDNNLMKFFLHEIYSTQNFEKITQIIDSFINNGISLKKIIYRYIIESLKSTKHNEEFYKILLEIINTVANVKNESIEKNVHFLLKISLLIKKQQISLT